MRILLVEDDRMILSALAYSLRQEGFELIECTTAAEGLRAARTGQYDLALLDVMLPDGSGHDVCRAVKARGDLPVLFLTARDEEVSVVMGLDIGADDYITKPFRLQELLSRIRSVLRRYQRGGALAPVALGGGVTVNLAKAQVYRDGQEIILTALEYRLLLCFVNNRGRVLSRDQILSQIWDAAGDFVNDNTLTVYIKRLRDKLEENPAEPRLIETVRGLGYRLGGNYGS
ncbi:response regulator transcription factor [Feifania hominis]|uniref:Stage 0 sporulation protein A homolog n=1 Tax=Feifania hominis TaxID=2763660 RepID=A0A926HVN8_9FIRM|nr:response regulator transcription factor [Feifania hominis]MBC8537185.1 response regulator transcription factor [Feifania hominis]